jgi:hypothetical protein
MLSGERYARLLNASLAVPSCGTIANEVVRKHFEIPAAKACLLAPQSLALEAAGFVHMVNCVFTDESNVLDHLEYLFKNPDDLERITLAGHQLVHSSHTIQHRDQLYQWFRLHRKLRPNQRIVQPGPFKPLTITENPQMHNSHIVVNGIDRALLKTGYQQMWAGDYAGARKAFLQCLNYQASPEPKLAMVILSLLTGDTVAARSWYAKLDPTDDGTPDPVEWAFFILMTLCEGNGEEASAAAGKLQRLRHPALDRTRHIVAEATVNQLHMTADPQVSYSIHRLPERDPKEWVSMICSMLRACGQPGMAKRVSRVRQAVTSHSDENIETGTPDSNQAVAVRRKPNTSRRVAISTKDWVRKHLWRRIKGTLQTVEGKIGYFLPYKSSAASCDEWFRMIEKLSSQEPISKVIFIGARRGRYLTESFLLGVRKNPTLPSVVLVNEDERVLNGLLQRYAHDPQIVQISKSAELLPGDSGVLLIVDGSELKSIQKYPQHLACATIVVLDDINDERTQALHLSLASDSGYTLIAHNPEHLNGYAIMRRNWSNSRMYTCSSEA